MCVIGVALSSGAKRGWLPHFCHQPTVATRCKSVDGKADGKAAIAASWLCHDQHSVATRAANFRTNELLVGDSLACVAFCLYKQIMAIVMSPTFGGWQAPLSFNLLRFEELVGFTLTIAGTWVATSTLNGDYEARTADVNEAVQRVTRTWLLSMPIMAAQLVLVTAAESGSLILDERFALKLPLAASGVGEPFVSAAGILGVMAIWRTYYAGFLDWGHFLSYDVSRGSGPDLDRHRRAWWETLFIALGITAVAGAAAVAAHVSILP